MAEPSRVYVYMTRVGSFGFLLLKLVADNKIHGENLIAGKLNPDLTHCHIDNQNWKLIINRFSELGTCYHRVVVFYYKIQLKGDLSS